MRAISFVTGSLLPDHRSGDVETGYVHTCEWYTAFCELPNVDGLKMWPLIRVEVFASSRSDLISDNAHLWRLEADAGLRGVAEPGVADGEHAEPGRA